MKSAKVRKSESRDFYKERKALLHATSAKTWSWQSGCPVVVLHCRLKVTELKLKEMAITRAFKREDGVLMRGHYLQLWYGSSRP